ncbi:MAG: VOC family protein [Kordiimonadaceae bacterium]|nr:VOC family protein [Kordiimonadaceae bacterium]
MIGYTTVGTNDISAAAKFYDAVAAVLGGVRVMEFNEKGEPVTEGGAFIMWGNGEGKPGFAVTKPFNGEAATVGNGNMIGLSAGNRATVDKLYDAAITAGGSCEGKPGIRGDDSSGFYAAYFRDLDGNKLAAYYMGTE